MHIFIHFVFFSMGGATGFLIPDLVQSIIRYKSRNSNCAFPLDRLYVSLVLRLSLGAVCALAWTIAALGTEGIAAAALRSILCSTILVIALVDIRIRIIPNELIAFLLITGSVFQWIRFGGRALMISTVCLAAMTALFLAAAAVTGFSAVGAGDVKLAGAMGLMLGYPGVVTALAVMSAALILYSLLGLLSGKLSLKTMVPMAPFMMLGSGAALVYGCFPIAFP